MICHIFGALIYRAWCRNVDTRTMVFISMITVSLQTFLNFSFAKRWNLDWGIPDIVFLFTTDAIFGTVTMLLYNLPIMAFFGKIIPARID